MTGNVSYQKEPLIAIASEQKTVGEKNDREREREREKKILLVIILLTSLYGTGYHHLPLLSFSGRNAY